MNRENVNSVARLFEALDTTGIQNYTKKDTKIEKCQKEQKNVKFSLQDRIFSIILVHKMLGHKKSKLDTKTPLKNLDTMSYEITPIWCQTTPSGNTASVT